MESFSNFRHRAAALSAAAITLSCASAFAADFTSTWFISDGIWGDAANWSPSAFFPKNGNGGATYDAVLGNGATITLDQNIVIQQFTHTSGTVTGSFSLTLNSNLAWTGGAMSGTGTTTVSGAASTINDTAGLLFLGRVLTNNGTISFDSADGSNGIFFGADSATAGVLNNAGTFNVTAGGDFNQFFGNAGHVINNSGTWNVSGPGPRATWASGWSSTTPGW